MFGAIYTALSGMNAYSQGLDVIGNNVANLNTPGFKISDPLFREIVYRNQQSTAANLARPNGAGVEANSSSMAFVQGELRDTDNPLDAAIDGNGFFVLDEDGERRYTRAGQFQFDQDGILVERASGAKVLMSTEASAEGYFDLNTARTSPPKATTEVVLVGTLARGGTAVVYELPNITVYDSTGAPIVLKARFLRDSTNPLKWKVEIVNSSNSVQGSGELIFNADSTPAEGSTQLTVTVDAKDMDDVPVTFKFGEAGKFSGVSTPSSSTTSQLQVLRQDGLQLGSLTKTEFDEQGQLKMTYSNGKTDVVGTLVLAQFDAPQQLRALGGSFFAATPTAQPLLGKGLSGGIGRVSGGKLEMSNVELTQQFTDLIIMQRGYQASSQISSVANELIQTLLSLERR